MTPTKSTLHISHDPLHAWKLLRDHLGEVTHLMENYKDNVVAPVGGVHVKVKRDWIRLYNYKNMIMNWVDKIEQHIKIQIIQEHPVQVACNVCVWEGVR